MDFAVALVVTAERGIEDPLAGADAAVIANFASVWVLAGSADRNETSSISGSNVRVVREEELVPEFAIFNNLEPAAAGNADRKLAEWQRHQIAQLSIARLMDTPAFVLWNGRDSSEIPSAGSAHVRNGNRLRAELMSHAPSIDMQFAAAAKTLAVPLVAPARRFRPRAFDTEAVLALLERQRQRLLPNRFRPELYLASTSGWSAESLYVTELLGSDSADALHAIGETASAKQFQR